MRKLTLLVLLVGAAVGFRGTARVSQTAHGVKVVNNDSYPLQIVSVTPQLSEDATELTGMVVTLRNTGGAPCVAFAVSLVLTFGNSETREVRLQEDHVALGYAKPYSPTDPIPGNQIYTVDRTGTLRVSAREPATIVGVEARLDYVELADGKRYGPDPERVGETFRMTRWGHAAERKRLLSIYDSSGLQALLEELKRE